jgi:hypothetical protein
MRDTGSRECGRLATALPWRYLPQSGCCRAKDEIMPPRMKKLIGTVLLVLLVCVYALVATAIATARLADAPGWAQALYFMVTGILWVVPAMFIISWMVREPRRSGDI